MTYTLTFREIGREDVQRCGGKGAHVGELTQAGFRVPPGFCITAQALPYLIEFNSFGARIGEIAAEIDFEDLGAVEAGTERIRSTIASARIPPDLEAEILERYRALMGDEPKHVAVRSSVAIRDSAISSFPGMMDTYHYVLGEGEVLERTRECWASLWTARAAFARHAKGISHDRGLIAPLVQVMVDADCAGVLFTANPISKDTSEIVIESNWGIGESVVSGRSLNDFFVLAKDGLAVRQSKVARKTVMVTMDRGAGSGRREQEVPLARAKASTLSDAQLLELGDAGTRIEQHFGFPVDVEWAYERERLYILQARRVQGL
jgi:pyruvate,water dikinase